MGDEAHIGLVDSHAEGNRRHHHDAVFLQEAPLVRGAGTGVQPGVIGQCRDALRGQRLGSGLDLAPRQAIDDPGLTAVAIEEVL